MESYTSQCLCETAVIVKSNQRVQTHLAKDFFVFFLECTAFLQCHTVSCEGILCSGNFLRYCGRVLHRCLVLFHTHQYLHQHAFYKMEKESIKRVRVCSFCMRVNLGNRLGYMGFHQSQTHICVDSQCRYKLQGRYLCS